MANAVCKSCETRAITPTNVSCGVATAICSGCRARGRSLTPDDPFRHGIWSFSDISEERPLVELTQREREVAILSCRGLSAKEIGGELGLSYRTIEAYRARLLEKFGARKLPELVAKLSGMPL